MTDETETNEPDFAAFEAAAEKGEEPPVADDETNTGETVEEVTPDPEVNDEADEPEKAEDDDKGKRRSKPASERIAEITRDKHEAIRRAEAAEERLRALETGERSETGDAPEPLSARPDPNDPKYEFGDADPQFQEDLMDWKVEQRFEIARQQQEADELRRAATERAGALDTGWKEQAAKAIERYDDFNETIADYQTKEPCPPLLAMAIQASEQGADVAYHLAKNPAENAELAQLAQTDPLEAARRFGRLEARFEARQDTRPTGKTVTDAPEPPRHNVRGGGGKFDVGADTTDFAAFERKANAAR